MPYPDDIKWEKSSEGTPNYNKEARKAVLEALKIAYGLKGRPVTVGEVQELGSNMPSQPETSLKISSHYIPGHWHVGGWSVFDFTDRVHSRLRFLSKKGGSVVEIKRGRRYFYYPKSPYSGDEIRDKVIDLRISPRYRSPFERGLEGFDQTEEGKALIRAFKSIGEDMAKEKETERLLAREGLVQDEDKKAERREQKREENIRKLLSQPEDSVSKSDPLKNLKESGN